jgi:hypothetical protein
MRSLQPHSSSNHGIIAVPSADRTPLGYVECVALEIAKLLPWLSARSLVVQPKLETFKSPLILARSSGLVLRVVQKPASTDFHPWRQLAPLFSRRPRPISVGGAFRPKTASLTISPITGPCLKPCPEPPPTSQTFSASGCRSKMKL